MDRYLGCICVEGGLIKKEVKVKVKVKDDLLHIRIERNKEVEKKIDSWNLINFYRCFMLREKVNVGLMKTAEDNDVLTLYPM